ncbi:uncharacterized protein LOC112004527 [Quercus suber]|uniref:uncharacterized protein LOC112004527 n=1 Tax=Quercus suber TaxID=58331 RepID=UPI0032DF49F5
MSIKNLSLGQGFVVFLGYQCYDLVSHRLHISRNVVFWEHCSFVEFSHFRASLSSPSVLYLFPNEAYIPSITTPYPPVTAPDSPVDFSIQPPDILDSFSSSPFNEQVEDEQVEDELPNPALGSPAPAPPKDFAQDIPPRHSTRWVEDGQQAHGRNRK